MCVFCVVEDVVDGQELRVGVFLVVCVLQDVLVVLDFFWIGDEGNVRMAHDQFIIV